MRLTLGSSSEHHPSHVDTGTGRQQKGKGRIEEDNQRPNSTTIDETLRGTCKAIVGQREHALSVTPNLKSIKTRGGQQPVGFKAKLAETVHVLLLPVNLCNDHGNERDGGAVETIDCLAVGIA